MIYITIPVFNASLYIENTVKSIQRQTVSDWRLLLVDDCSTDNSIKIIEALSKEDHRIIALSTGKNSGPARARNIGIEYALDHSADYLAFIDSDDVWESKYLEVMVEKAQECKADIVWCNILEYTVSNKEKAVVSSHGYADGTQLSTKKSISAFFENRNGLGSMVNKVYRASFIEKHNLRINEERVRAEDWEFNLMAFQCDPVVVPIEDALYNYIHYPRPSVMATYREQDYELYWRSRELQLQAAQKYDVEYDRNLFDGTLMYNIINNLKLLKKSNYPSADERMNYILNDPRFITLLKSSTHKSQCLPITFRLIYLAMRLRQNRLVKILL